MGTDEIFDYVMETPGNTNPNVLRSLLNNLDSGTNLPDNPAQDGVYNLQNTVDGGTGTLSWANGGASSGVLVVHGTTVGNVITLDKTAGEIMAAGQTGIVIVEYSLDGENMMRFHIGSFLCTPPTEYSFTAPAGPSSTITFYAPSANDYPTNEPPK